MKDLVIGKRISTFWEKACSKMEYASSGVRKDERIQMFTEWLQWQPLEDYKHFIKLLHKTKQEGLAKQLVASCKTVFIIY